MKIKLVNTCQLPGTEEVLHKCLLYHGPVNNWVIVELRRLVWSSKQLGQMELRREILARDIKGRVLNLKTITEVMGEREIPSEERWKEKRRHP